MSRLVSSSSCSWNQKATEFHTPVSVNRAVSSTKAGAMLASAA